MTKTVSKLPSVGFLSNIRVVVTEGELAEVWEVHLNVNPVDSNSLNIFNAKSKTDISLANHANIHSFL